MSADKEITPAGMYEQFFVPSLFVPWTKILLEHAQPRPGERVLDLACGTGIVTRMVAPMVEPEGHVVAVDHNPGMLDVASEMYDGENVEWKQGDATSLDLPDAAFDLLLCQQGMQFFPDRAAAAAEMRRVVADGGRAVVEVWQPLDRQVVYEALIGSEARHLDVPIDEVGAPFTLGDPDELERLLRDAGFDDVEILQRSHDVEFARPETFVKLTIVSAAAVMPEFAQDDEKALAELVEAVSRDSESVLQRHLTGDKLVFPMHANIAIARA